MPTELMNTQPMSKYNQFLNDRYTNTTFLLRQLTKQCLKFNHARNHIGNLSNMANDGIARCKRGLFSIILTLVLVQQKVKLLNY